MTQRAAFYRYALYKIDPAWLRLPDEERALHKKELAAAVSSTPDCEVHAYSTVAFEGDDAAELLALVEELRGSAASAYTARDVPIFTGVRMPLEAILDQLDGS